MRSFNLCRAWLSLFPFALPCRMFARLQVYGDPIAVVSFHTLATGKSCLGFTLVAVPAGVSVHANLSFHHDMHVHLKLSF